MCEKGAVEREHLESQPERKRVDAGSEDAKKVLDPLAGLVTNTF